jgi:hypothetical protein
VDDVEVLWYRNPTALVHRMRALADEFESRDPVDGPMFAATLRQVLSGDYDPLPDRLPELGEDAR